MAPLDILLQATEVHLPRQAPHISDRHSWAVWEPCYISALHYTKRLILWQSPVTPHIYPLILHLEISQEWRMICSYIGDSSCIFDGPTLWPALWTSRFCGVGPVLLLLYLLTSGMGHLGNGPMKFTWIAIQFTLWEVLSPLTVYSRFVILPCRRVVKAPG